MFHVTGAVTGTGGMSVDHIMSEAGFDLSDGDDDEPVADDEADELSVPTALPGGGLPLAPTVASTAGAQPTKGGVLASSKPPTGIRRDSDSRKAVRFAAAVEAIPLPSRASMDSEGAESNASVGVEEHGTEDMHFLRCFNSVIMF